MLSPPSDSNAKGPFGDYEINQSEQSKQSAGLSSPLSLESDPKLFSNISGKQEFDNNVDSEAVDNFSLSSSINSSVSRQEHDSLIFERLVQDPLIDAQPIPHSLPRHVSCETFIPASLDTTTHLINDPDTDFMEHHQQTELGFSSRRSSLANLEAAFGGSSSRRGSNINLSNPIYRKNSFSTLSRQNTNNSFSNLTQQFQNATPSRTNLQQQDQQQQDQQQYQQQMPSLTTTFSGSSGFSFNSPRGNLSNSTSPTMRNKSFCSFADIITQEDQELRQPIRRPSISSSLSNQILRTNSLSNSPSMHRSPSNLSQTPSSAYNPSSLRNPQQINRNKQIPPPVSATATLTSTNAGDEDDSIFATSPDSKVSRLGSSIHNPARKSYSAKVVNN